MRRILISCLFALFSCIVSAQSRPNNTLLDTYYGMEQNDQYQYSGKDSILDNINGLLKWQKFSLWHYLGDNHNYDASLCIYFDEIYPSVKVMRQVAQETDSVFGELFVKSSSFENADTTVRINPSLYTKPQQIIDYFKNRFNVFDKKYKARPNSEMKCLAFRVVIVACQQYQDQNLSTYMIQGSFDWNGSHGCPTYSKYITYDNKGKRLKYDDIFLPGSKKKVLPLLVNAYKSQLREDFAEYSWTIQDIGDNVAIVKEGVLFYYEPYSIGCGAEGQYNLILKYEDLKGLMK